MKYGPARYYVAERSADGSRLILDGPYTEDKAFSKVVRSAKLGLLVVRMEVGESEGVAA